MYKKILSLLSKHKAFSDLQFGFRKTLAKITGYIYEHLDKGLSLAVISLKLQNFWYNQPQYIIILVGKTP